MVARVLSFKYYNGTGYERHEDFNGTPNSSMHGPRLKLTMHA